MAAETVLTVAIMLMVAGMAVYVWKLQREVRRLRAHAASVAGELRAMTRLGELGHGLLDQVVEQTEGAALGIIRQCDAIDAALDAGDDAATAVRLAVNELLSTMQFQDLARQQIEHVQQVHDALQAHAQSLAGYLESPGEGDFPGKPLAEQLDDFYQCYVMDAQRRVHARQMGGAVEESGAAPAVELF